MNIVILADLPSIHTKVWIKYLTEKCHDVSVITFRPDIDHKGQYDYFDLHPFGKLKYLIYAPEIRMTVKEKNPDLVMGFFLTSYGFLAAFTGAKPLVLWGQGSDVLIGSKKFLLRQFVKFAIKRANLVICDNFNSAEKLENLGYPKEKMITMSYGIDIDLFNPGPQEKGLVISTRNLNPIYNVKLFIQAALLNYYGTFNAHFSIVGDGSQRRPLEKMVKELGNTIKFHGYVEQSKLARLLRKAEVFVSIPFSDAGGLSVQEAMASGVFPILSDIPINAALVEDGVNGFLVPTDNIAILANRIVEALKDKKLRQQANSYNVSYARKHFSQKINMDKIYKRIMEIM